MDTPEFVAPMLALPLPTAGLGPYGQEWVLEEKFDGQRIIACVGANALRTWSRPRPNAEVHQKNVPTHISAALLQLPHGVYDGEILVPGGRSWDAGRNDRRGDSMVMLFDVIQLLGEDLTATAYDERRTLLEMALGHIRAGAGAVGISTARPVSQAALEAIWEAGGEGAILKRRASFYRPGKRSWDWLKVKQCQTSILTIVGFKPGKTGPHASVVLRDDDGNETSVSARPERVTGPITAVIGRKLRIEYQCRTPSGNYRHPQFDRMVDEA